MAPSNIHAAFLLIRSLCSDLGHRFKRARCWTPERITLGLILLISQTGMTSIEKMMPEWAELMKLPSAPSDSTFVEARKKLVKQHPDALKNIWKSLVDKALALVPMARRTMSERQIIAVDGTWVWAPHAAGTIQRWGQPKGAHGKKLHYAQMLLVTALDVLTRIPVAATVLAHDGAERVGLQAFLDAILPKSVLLLDRGYPGKKLLAEIVSKNVDLVWRMQSSDANSWNAVFLFLQEYGKPREKRVKITLPKRTSDGKDIEIEVRLIRRPFLRGRPKKGADRNPMVLMTTLLDEKEWPAERLIQLYDRRWVIEDWHRDIKVRFGLESFHSRSDILIEQEIHALLAWMTLCSIIERNAYDRIERSRGIQNLDDPKRYQISMSNVYQATSKIFARLLVNPDINAVIAASEIDLRWLDSTARRRRPGRSAPRERKAPRGSW